MQGYSAFRLNLHWSARIRKHAVEFVNSRLRVTTRYYILLVRQREARENVHTEMEFRWSLGHCSIHTYLLFGCYFRARRLWWRGGPSYSNTFRLRRAGSWGAAFGLRQILVGLAQQPEHFSAPRLRPLQ